MRRLLKSNWLRFSVLTAATSVAAVFISLHFFSTDLLFFLLNKRISFLEPSGKKFHLIRLSKDEIGLDLISDKSEVIVSSRWTPHFSLFRMQAILSGQVAYLDHDIAVKVEIPMHFSSDPLHELNLNFHGTLQELKWNVHGTLNRTSGQWEGNLHTQLVHSVWGEFSPDIHLKWEKTTQVVLSLLPSNIKSQFLQADQEIQLKLDWNQGLVVSSLNAESVSILVSDQKIAVKQLSLELNNQAERTTYQLRGKIPTLSLTPPISKSLNDFFLIAHFSGIVNLNTPQGPALSIQGKIQDPIKSLAVRFSVKGPSVQPQFQANFEGQLFEGSSIDSAVRDFFPSTKLLSGKFRGSWSNQTLQADLEPSTLVFGNYLVTGLHSSLKGNIQKRVISVQETNLQVADGSVSLAPFQIALEKPETQLAFRADNLDLNKILSGYPKSKLSGTGRFKGSGHLTLRTPELFLSSLHFENSTPGTISYGDPSQPYFEKKIIYLNEFQDLLAQGQQALVFKALENFHYSRVKLQAERLSAEQMKVLLNLKGKNPDLAKGQPFDITFPIEGEIASLVQGSLLQQPVTNELNKRSLETE